MAKKPTASMPAGDLPAPPSPEETFFDIKVGKVMPNVFGITFRPGQTYRVKDRVVEALGDAVTEKVPAPAA